MRTVVAGFLAILASVATATSLLLALTGIVAADPERPGRLGAIALSSPTVRDEAADYLIDRMRQQGVGDGVTDAQAREVIDQVLADPEVRDELSRIQVDDQGQIRLDGVYDVVGQRRLQEAGRGREARALRNLGPETTTLDGAEEIGGVASAVRGIALVGALVAAVVAVVVGSLALAAARRRLACLGAILVGSGVIVALGIEVAPAFAAEGGSDWLTAARGLDEALGTMGTVSVAALVVLGAILVVLGLRRSAESAPVHAHDGPSRR